MTVLAIQAAKHLGQKSNWKYSNLEYQKLIYIAHMFHLGAEHEPLVFGNFEAWPYGPVHPDVYHLLKLFGALAVPKTFGLFKFIEDIETGSESAWLDDAANAFPPGNGARLVAVTHQKQSAWQRHHGTNRKSVVIPTDSIIAEYKFFQNG